MTNFHFNGNVGSHVIDRATEHPPAASPLVLIVEDHEDTRFLLRYLFREAGLSR